MNEPLALIDRDGPVATITLNRPEALNALSLALEAALADAFEALGEDPGVRAIILTGAGRAFSVGVDLKELGSSPTGLRDRDWHGPKSLAETMRRRRKPVIAAVNGYAVTGGLELALQCDFLIASDAARFADTHARVGITPSWGLTQILPRLIGPNRAKQMSLTGQYVDAGQAAAWGLANEVAPAADLMRRAGEIAAEIAETDEVAMTRIHGLIDDGLKLPLDDAFALERSVFDKHIAGVTHETVEANRQRVQARGKRVAGGAA